MNSLWQSPVVILAILTWLAAPPTGLADAAQREAFRRHTMPKARVVLTNAGLPQQGSVAAVAASTPPPDEPPPDVEVVTKASQGEKPAAEPKADQKDEQWWRKRVTTARATLKGDQDAVEALQTRINGLQRDSVNRDNPGQAAKLREELQKALATLEATKKQIDLDQKAILAIQEEARRADVPASWVR